MILCMRVLILALLAAALAPTPARARTLFRFPAEDPQGTLFMKNLIVHVDHDTANTGTRTKCKNFAGDPFPACYDGHEGTDYLLLWGFTTMDSHNVKVVAAADGEVIATEDGNYDRCHADTGFTVSCDGHPMKANRVKLRHADGLVSSYVHLKKGSVKVKVGDKVRCGKVLGFVGSSGNSAAPHLHFQVFDARGKVLDPYAGKLSQPQTYWTRQVGRFGWPGDRCQGDPYPDGGAGPAPDSGVSARDAGGSGSGDGGAGAVTSSRGCAAAGGARGTGGAGWLLLALWAARRRRTVRRARRG
jgi:hypothetical protein